MEKNLSYATLVLSFIAVIFSITGAFGLDVWIASTQWLIIAAVLGIYSLFFKK